MADFEFTSTETASMVDPEEYLNYLIIERCNEIYYKIIRHDTEYRNLQTRFASCLQELLQLLSEPKQTEIVTEKLAGIISGMEMLLPRLTYRQGLKDGLRLEKWAGKDETNQ